MENKELKIKVIGIGGAGNNIVNSMNENKLDGVELYVANTDRQVLDASPVANKIYLGEQYNGAGGNPENGRVAAEKTFAKIKGITSATELVFLTAGMGGGTGTGASPVFARAAKEAGAMVVAVVTTPFAFEGPRRLDNAAYGLRELKKYADNIVTVSNNRIIDIYGRAPFTESLIRSNEIITQAILSITNLVSANSIINVDLADIKAVMKSNTNAFISMGTSEGDNAAEEAAYNALNSPLLENGIQGANNAIINITGGKDLSLADAVKAVEAIKHVAGEDMEIVFGVTINEEYGDTVSVTVIATGVTDVASVKLEEATKESKEAAKKEQTLIQNFVQQDEPQDSEETNPVSIAESENQEQDIPKESDENEQRPVFVQPNQDVQLFRNDNTYQHTY